VLRKGGGVLAVDAGARSLADRDEAAFAPWVVVASPATAMAMLAPAMPSLFMESPHPSFTRVVS
jgi:hypothetical protein